MENRTEVTEFILLGLANDPHLQAPLFITFLLIYLITLVGNLGMILLILLDSPVTPTVLAGLLNGEKVMSFSVCASQMFFFVVFATVENCLLALMAYDRYAAVCKPLHYTITMTMSKCAWLVIGSYVYGFLNASVHTGDTFVLSFCESNVIHHFFCDIPAVMVLSCSDRHISELVLVYLGSFNIFFALLIIWISYILIFVTILKMYSSAGHQKAMSTCASHFTAVSIFYGTLIFMYVQPSSSHSMDTDKIASVFYTVIIPVLNPVVYSLRNKEVKSAFTKILVKPLYELGF
uniref:Olfactory receptor n=1 Tax=Castor canadensis TaxID=51338 RepID=A0A8C0WJI0_CASCN